MSVNQCRCCGNQTHNPKFCNSSCAAKINNITKPKRKPLGKCKKCFVSVPKRATYCKECFKLWGKEDMTLGEATYTRVHKSSAFCFVRSRARVSEKFRNSSCCERCGYSKHIECCHIKPISSFSIDTMISEINKSENLIMLCPNCHWEFDHPEQVIWWSWVRIPPAMFNF